MFVRLSKTKTLFSEHWEAQVRSEHKDGPFSCQGDGATTKRSLLSAKKWNHLKPFPSFPPLSILRNDPLPSVHSAGSRKRGMEQTS